MNDMQKLERMGYRFTLDGIVIRVKKYGDSPDMSDVLMHLDKDVVRQVLEDREKGFQTVEPEEVRIKGKAIKHFAQGVKMALEDGMLISADVLYRKNQDEALFYLTPPGVDVWRYVEKSKDEMIAQIEGKPVAENSKLYAELGSLCACLGEHYGQ